MSAARPLAARLCLLLLVPAALGEAKQPKTVQRYIKCGTNATAHECSVTETLTDDAPGAARLLSEGAEALCPVDQYRESENVVVIPCVPVQARVDYDLLEDEDLIITDVPVGTKNLKVDIHANEDVDTRIIDVTTGECIVGYDCHPCGEDGCTDEDYHGMLLTFSGDDTDDDVLETTQITGSTTRPLRIEVFANEDLSGHVDITDDGLEPCEEDAVPPGCRPCDTYTRCTEPEVPQCDGTHIVSCGAEESMPANEALAMQAGAAAANEDEGLRLFDGTLGATASQHPGGARPRLAPMVAAVAAAALASLAVGLSAAAVRRQGWAGRSGASEGSLPQPLTSTEEEQEQGQEQEQEDLVAQRAQP